MVLEPGRLVDKDRGLWTLRREFESRPGYHYLVTSPLFCWGWCFVCFGGFFFCLGCFSGLFLVAFGTVWVLFSY